MRGPLPTRALREPLLFLACMALALPELSAQPSVTTVTRRIDAAVQVRAAQVTGFSDIEHYAVYKGSEKTQPLAEMTVKDIYRKGVGRKFIVLSGSGSTLIRKLGLMPILNAQKNLSEPGKIEQSWFNTANYRMKLTQAPPKQINGRLCYAIAITPKHRARNTIKGTLWVDAQDFSAVKVVGIASKRPTILTGTTHIVRNYKDIHGYSMATFSRAESHSHIVGTIVITVRYSQYHLDLRRSPDTGVTVASDGAE